MISNQIKNNAPLIKYVIDLGFVLAECSFPNMTLYSKENGNHYEIYFTEVDKVESVFIKKYVPVENGESKWTLEGRYLTYEKVIDLLNTDFKYELRKLKLKKLINE